MKPAAQERADLLRGVNWSEGLILAPAHFEAIEARAVRLFSLLAHLGGQHGLCDPSLPPQIALRVTDDQKQLEVAVHQLFALSRGGTPIAVHPARNPALCTLGLDQLRAAQRRLVVVVVPQAGFVLDGAPGDDPEHRRLTTPQAHRYPAYGVQLVPHGAPVPDTGVAVARIQRTGEGTWALDASFLPHAVRMDLIPGMQLDRAGLVEEAVRVVAAAWDAAQTARPDVVGVLSAAAIALDRLRIRLDRADLSAEAAADLAEEIVLPLSVALDRLGLSCDRLPGRTSDPADAKPAVGYLRDAIVWFEAALGKIPTGRSTPPPPGPARVFDFRTSAELGTRLEIDGRALQRESLARLVRQGDTQEGELRLGAAICRLLFAADVPLPRDHGPIRYAVWLVDDKRKALFSDEPEFEVTVEGHRNFLMGRVSVPHCRDVRRIIVRPLDETSPPLRAVHVLKDVLATR